MTLVESRGVGGRASLLGTTPPPPGQPELRWSRFVPATAAEGPGVRAAV